MKKPAVGTRKVYGLPVFCGGIGSLYYATDSLTIYTYFYLDFIDLTADHEP